MKPFPPPHFYHIAEPSNMTSIRRHGLLSTERLVRRAVRNNAQRDAILGTHRADSLILRDGVYIRDQRPMHIQGLVKMFRFAEEPSFLAVEPEIRKLSRDYFNKCAAKARGTLSDVSSFAVRWCERAWEISINLHMGIYGVQWADHPTKLSVATFKNAILISEFFADRQLEVLQRRRIEAQHKCRERLEEVFENNKKIPMTLRTLRDRHGIKKDEVISCVKSHPDVFGIMTVDPPHGGSKSTLVFLKSNPPPGWRSKK